MCDWACENQPCEHKLHQVIFFKTRRVPATGLRLAQAWFLKIDPVWIVGMHVCVCLRLRVLITSSVMWCDMDLLRLVKQVL